MPSSTNITERTARPWSGPRGGGITLHCGRGAKAHSLQWWHPSHGASQGEGIQPLSRASVVRPGGEGIPTSSRDVFCRFLRLRSCFLPSRLHVALARGSAERAARTVLWYQYLFIGLMETTLEAANESKLLGSLHPVPFELNCFWRGCRGLAFYFIFLTALVRSRSRTGLSSISLMTDDGIFCGSMRPRERGGQAASRPPCGRPRPSTPVPLHARASNSTFAPNLSPSPSSFPSQTYIIKLSFRPLLPPSSPIFALVDLQRPWRLLEA